MGVCWLFLTGRHPGNLYEGQIEDRMLTKHLSQESISYYGYLVVDSQPDHESRRLRDHKGVIHKKPLKGKKKIDNKSARTIVITDKVLWNHLVEFHNANLKYHESRIFGAGIDQYPFFEHIERNASTIRLKKAYEACGFHYRSWHCCRHFRATFLIGETGNNILAKLWLGHSSEKVLSRYVHTYEAVVRAAKKRKEDGKFKTLNPLT